MIRPSPVLLVSLLVACGGHRPADAAGPPPKGGVAEAAARDDSVRAIVDRYEAGDVALGEATGFLADLLEPTRGFAVGGKQSARAIELFEATSRELRRRDAKRLGAADSLVTH